jgi:predicted AAA+ superfamily ATPase
MKYIYRFIEPQLKNTVKTFPVVFLTGARQTGKTTVLKRLFSKTFNYVSMELPHIRELALNDPIAFFDIISQGWLH